MTKAQALSNLANQIASMHLNELENVSATKETITLLNGDKHVLKGQTVISFADVKVRLDEIQKYRALQAYLMEALKAKVNALAEAKFEAFDNPHEAPEKPQYEDEPKLEPATESDMFDKFTLETKAEYISNVAKAAVIGKFIHRTGKLTTMRTAVNDIAEARFMELEPGKKTPIVIDRLYTPEELLELHSELSAKHQALEQQINYIHATVNNSMLAEDNREAIVINRLRADVNTENNNLRAAYEVALAEYLANTATARATFTTEKANRINAISRLKIVIPDLFKDLVAEMLTKYNVVEEG